MIRGKKNATVTSQVGTNNDWFEGVVKEVITESPDVNTYIFTTPRPIHHLAGQHYELRLTAENGYQAARLYSASLPGNGESTLQLTIMKVPGGEVSSYVVDELQTGDTVELRGPFGRFFVWDPKNTDPILLIGGGSGIIPMHSILEAHRLEKSSAPLKVLYSSHSFEDILFKDDFLTDENTTITLTKNHPSDWKGKRGRITAGELEEILKNLPSKPLCYICGMTSFVNAVSEGLESLGIPSDSIRTERFG